MANFKADFIGIGFGRSGTTWATHVLKQHPNICFSSVKEVEFFNEKDWNGRHNENYDKGVDFYRSFWPKNIPKGSKIGECSPIYLWGTEAAKRIYKHNPKIKLFVFMRNPADKVFTHFLVEKDSGGKVAPYRSFEDALKKHKHLLEYASYYEQLKRYYDLFDKDQIGIFILEEMSRDKKKTAKALYKFIGVDQNFNPSMEQQNPTLYADKPLLNTMKNFVFNLPIYVVRNKMMLSIIPEKVLYKLSKSKLTKTYERLRTKVTKALSGAKRPEMKESTRKWIMDYYKTDIKKLEKLTERDLSFWFK